MCDLSGGNVTIAIVRVGSGSVQGISSSNTPVGSIRGNAKAYEFGAKAKRVSSLGTSSPSTVNGQF